MKIAGLMRARNEAWVVQCSVPALLEWADVAVVLDHGSTDETPQMLSDLKDEFKARLQVFRIEDKDWNEAEHMQKLFEFGKALEPTHFALLDADEILSASNLPIIKFMLADLAPGEGLDLRMVAVWRSLDKWRSDPCIWTRSWVSMAFRDSPRLRWIADTDGYGHHSRLPLGIEDQTKVVTAGGVLHLQWAQWSRVLWKHRWYKMIEHSRWPGRRSFEDINKMYEIALQEDGLELTQIPPEWWGSYRKDKIRLDIEPWHKKECEKMLERHGYDYFNQLNLWGWPG